MSSEQTFEQQRFQALIDSLTTTLKDGKAFEKDISATDFRMLLLGGLQAFFGKIGKDEGIRITIAPDGLSVGVTDGRDITVRINGFGQKEAKTVISGQPFSSWTKPEVVTITTHASNDLTFKDRFMVNKVDVRPLSIHGFNIRGSVAPAFDASGLFKIMKGHFIETMATKGVDIQTFSVRATPNNMLHLSVGQGPLSYPPR